MDKLISKNNTHLTLETFFDHKKTPKSLSGF
jgi:hypothetical protein